MLPPGSFQAALAPASACTGPGRPLPTIGTLWRVLPSRRKPPRLHVAGPETGFDNQACWHGGGDAAALQGNARETW